MWQSFTFRDPDILTCIWCKTTFMSSGFHLLLSLSMFWVRSAVLFSLLFTQLFFLWTNTRGRHSSHKHTLTICFFRINIVFTQNLTQKLIQKQRAVDPVLWLCPRSDGWTQIPSETRFSPVQNPVWPTVSTLSPAKVCLSFVGFRDDEWTLKKSEVQVLEEFCPLLRLSAPSHWSST